MSEDTEALLAAFRAGFQDKLHDASGLVRLAEMAAAKKHKLRALELARVAIAAAGDDPRTLRRARAVLHALIPGYHVPMMNDARRNLAWDNALRRAIRPGMHVLEIGTGAGMLAMMAARARAAKVVTCESDPLLAGLARELAARNGFGDRIGVIAKRSRDLALGVDLERPVDLLFCDIFTNDLLGFDPLAAIADAKARLLAPGAPVMPAAASLQVALVHSRSYGRVSHIDSAAGFDLTPMADFAAVRRPLEIGDPGMACVTALATAFRFDFAGPPIALKGENRIICRAGADAEANGIAYWIRLELDSETLLEARPEPGATFFSRLIYQPLPEPMRLRAGQAVQLAACYEGTEFEVWVAR